MNETRNETGLTLGSASGSRVRPEHQRESSPVKVFGLPVTAIAVACDRQGAFRLLHYQALWLGLAFAAVDVVSLDPMKPSTHADSFWHESGTRTFVRARL